MANVTVTTHIDVKRLTNKINSDKFGTFLATEWHGLYADWVPFRTGELYRKVRITPWQIEHYADHAAAVWNMNANFRKEFHPHASREWSKAAQPFQKPKLVNAAQIFVNRGGLNLSG